MLHNLKFFHWTRLKIIQAFYWTRLNIANGISPRSSKISYWLLQEITPGFPAAAGQCASGQPVRPPPFHRIPPQAGVFLRLKSIYKLWNENINLFDNMRHGENEVRLQALYRSQETIHLSHLSNVLVDRRVIFRTVSCQEPTHTYLDVSFSPPPFLSFSTPPSAAQATQAQSTSYPLTGWTYHPLLWIKPWWRNLILESLYEQAWITHKAVDQAPNGEIQTNTKASQKPGDLRFL
jgi:hypothetical protein